MQRILPRGEIESLDHTSIPRLRLPVRASVFADRAARLRQLAADNPAGAYLNLLAVLVDGQHRELAALPDTPLPAELIETARTHGMPPLLASGWKRDARWRAILTGLLTHMTQAPGVPEAAVNVCRGLLAQLQEQTQAIEELADALLAEQLAEDQGAAAPFVMAALQVYWTHLACSLDESQLSVTSPFGVCPACGSLPVASIVRVGGREDGCRYLCCPRCSLEWHLVRVTCSHCESTKSVAYHAIEDGPEGIKAESCDNCHTYRKIFYQEKQLGVDPVADDLASLALDVLMGEEGYSRSSGNPLLWQQS